QHGALCGHGRIVEEQTAQVPVHVAAMQDAYDDLLPRVAALRGADRAPAEIGLERDRRLVELGAPARYAGLDAQDVERGVAAEASPLFMERIAQRLGPVCRDEHVRSGATGPAGARDVCDVTVKRTRRGFILRERGLGPIEYGPQEVVRTQAVYADHGKLGLLEAREERRHELLHVREHTLDGARINVQQQVV